MSAEYNQTGVLSDADLKNKLIQEYQGKELKEHNFPTEVIELPSKGWYYNENHPLSSGTVEMRYMTARDEDILTSKNLRKQKVVLEKLLQALIVTPGVFLKDVLAVDVFGLMIAARVLGYGKDYNVEIPDPELPTHKQKVKIDLTTLNEIEHTFLDEYKHSNEFTFVLPKSGAVVKWKLLTYKEDFDLSNKSDNVATGRGQVESTSSDSLKRQIVEIDGERNPERISKYVDSMLAIDSKSLRVQIQSMKPGIDTSIKYISEITGDELTIDLPLTTEFFWPTT